MLYDGRIQQAIDELQSKGLNPTVGGDHDYEEARMAYVMGRGCALKKRHHTKSEAWEYMRQIKRKRRDQFFEAYQCNHCSGWHLAKGEPR